MSILPSPTYNCYTLHVYVLTKIQILGQQSLDNLANIVMRRLFQSSNFLNNRKRFSSSIVNNGNTNNICIAIALLIFVEQHLAITCNTVKPITQLRKISVWLGSDMVIELKLSLAKGFSSKRFGYMYKYFAVAFISAWCFLLHTGQVLYYQ